MQVQPQNLRQLLQREPSLPIPHPTRRLDSRAFGARYLPSAPLASRFQLPSGLSDSPGLWGAVHTTLPYQLHSFILMSYEVEVNLGIRPFLGGMLPYKHHC